MSTREDACKSVVIGTDATTLAFDGNNSHVKSLIETGDDRDVFKFRVKDHQTPMIDDLKLVVYL